MSAAQLALYFDAPAVAPVEADPVAWVDMTEAERVAVRREAAGRKADKRAAELAGALAAGDFKTGRLSWSTGAEWFAAYRAIIARRCGAPRNAAKAAHWAGLIGDGSAVIARASLYELGELRADLQTCDVPAYRRAVHPRTRAYDLISKREQTLRNEAAEAAPVAAPVAEAGRTLYLVACSASKSPAPAPARDLYLGDLFARSRRYVEALGADWAILSARHGLVEPASVVAPYDQRLGTDKRARGAWAARVAAQLGELGPGDRVVFLAGRAYRDQLGAELAGRGVAVEAPLSGLGIGHQRQRLGELVAELAPAPLPLFACAA